MRRMTLTPNKKTYKELNENKMIYMMNTLFMSSLGDSTKNHQFLTTTNTSRTRSRQPSCSNIEDSNRAPNCIQSNSGAKNYQVSSIKNQINSKQLYLEAQNPPETFISKKLSPKYNGVNGATTLAQMNWYRSYQTLSRPQTSVTTTANKEYASSRGNPSKNCRNSNNKIGIRLGSASSSKHKHEQNNIEDALNLQYALQQPESVIQKTGSKPSKSIHSTKSLGVVQAYSVNSHKFFTNPNYPSQVRICIVANLTKVTAKERIISLYSIFESTTANPTYLDYLRESFSSQISPYLSSVPIPTVNIDMVENSLKKIQNRFCELYKMTTNRRSHSSSSSPKKVQNRPNLNRDVSFAMVFTHKSTMTVFIKGECQVSISSNYASRINKLSSHVVRNGTSAPMAVSAMGIKTKHYQKEETNLMDYVTLTSSGVTEYTTFTNTTNLHSNGTGSGWMHRQIWLSLIRQLFSLNEQALYPTSNAHNKSNNISLHEMLGRSMDSIISLFSTCLCAKNISMILLGFKNLEQLYKNNASTTTTTCDTMNENRAHKIESELDSTPSTVTNSYSTCDDNLELPYISKTFTNIYAAEHTKNSQQQSNEVE